jgi:hypothetical protein
MRLTSDLLEDKDGEQPVSTETAQQFRRSLLTHVIYQFVWSEDGKLPELSAESDKIAESSVCTAEFHKHFDR